MATKKYRIQQLQTDETLLTLHPETDASIVQVDKSITGTTATNVQAAIKELKDEIKSTADEVKDGVVTGVKGENETNFRKGQVTITKANIGLGNVNNTSDADKPISMATQQALDNVIAIAEGKTKTYVLEIANNEFFNSQEDSLYFSLTDEFVTIGGETISFGSLKTGDIILVKDLDVPDRYVGLKKQSDVLNFLYLYKLETQKVDLSDYALNEEITKIKDGNTIVKKAEQDKNGNDISTTYLKNNSNGKIESTGIINFIVEQKYPEIILESFDGIKATIMPAGIDINSGGANIASITLDGNNVVTENSFKTINGESIVGTGNIVTKLEDSGVEAGTYSVVQVNAKGIVTAGANIIEIGATGVTTPSANLASGGIFFQEI